MDLLAEHFVSVLNDRFGCRKRIGAEALELLRRHDWPGNVRELQHAVEAAVIVCEGSEILPGHLPIASRTPSAPSAATPSRPPAGDARLPTLEELERAHIESTLRETDGHRGNAAKILGISERNLYRKLREYGLLS